MWPRSIPVPKPKTEVSLRVRALRYLARREYSRAELRARLMPHVQEGEDLDVLLDELERKSWLSDARTATLLVDSKRGRFGSQRIVSELRRKGIAEPLIDQTLAQLKAGELEAAYAVWQKKFGVLPQDRKEKARQVRFLQSRGFSLDTIREVLKLSFVTEDMDG